MFPSCGTPACTQRHGTSSCGGLCRPSEHRTSGMSCARSDDDRVQIWVECAAIYGSMMTDAAVVNLRKVAMSACTQCHGQGGFSYRRQNGALAFAICTNCRGQRFIDDDEPPPPPAP